MPKSKKSKWMKNLLELFSKSLVLSIGFIVITTTIIISFAKAWDAGPPEGGPGDGNVELGSGGSVWSDAGGSISYGSGNVGIGTTSPAGKLDVSGSICMSGDCKSSWPSDTDGMQVCIVGGVCLGAYINKVGNTYYYASPHEASSGYIYLDKAMIQSVTVGSYACNNASYTSVERNTTNSVSFYTGANCTGAEYVAVNNNTDECTPPDGSGWTCVSIVPESLYIYSQNTYYSACYDYGAPSSQGNRRAVNDSYLVSNVQIELR